MHYFRYCGLFSIVAIVVVLRLATSCREFPESVLPRIPTSLYGLSVSAARPLTFTRTPFLDPVGRVAANRRSRFTCCTRSAEPQPIGALGLPAAAPDPADCLRLFPGDQFYPRVFPTYRSLAADRVFFQSIANTRPDRSAQSCCLSTRFC